MRTLALALVSLCLAAPAFAECNMPIRTFTIPDGSTSDQVTLATTQKRVKDYNQQMTDYQACLQKEDAALPKDAPKEQHKALLADYNRSVEEMQQTADTFNGELRKFKQKQAQDKAK